MDEKTKGFKKDYRNGPGLVSEQSATCWRRISKSCGFHAIAVSRTQVGDTSR